MAWSTRQLAELAGTSLRAVRHYHEVGLLDEPERTPNGYKQYGVAHLLRVLRIKRLTDLGFSLAQIADMGDSEDHPEQALRTLDAELAETIDRLQRVRMELSLILRHASSTDLPPELAVAAADAKLSGADRSFIAVMTRVLSPSTLAAYQHMLHSVSNEDPDPSDQELDELPADADEKTRQDLAERMLPRIRDLFANHPEIQDMEPSFDLDKNRANETMRAAVTDLYNPAQVDVLRRINALLTRDSTS